MEGQEFRVFLSVKTRSVIARTIGEVVARLIGEWGFASQTTTVCLGRESFLSVTSKMPPSVITPRSWKVDSPVVRVVNLVQLFTTLLAEVFLRRCLCAENTNAGSMLPDFANVTLHEESYQIFGQFDGGEKFGIWTVGKRKPGVIF